MGDGEGVGSEPAMFKAGTNWVGLSAAWVASKTAGSVFSPEGGSATAVVT